MWVLVLMVLPRGKELHRAQVSFSLGGRNCTEHRARGVKHKDPSGLWMFLCLEGPEGHFNPGTIKGGMVVDFPLLHFCRPMNETQGPHMLGERSAVSTSLAPRVIIMRHQARLYITWSITKRAR